VREQRCGQVGVFGRVHELAAQIVRRAPELGEALAERARELGQALGTEHDQPDHEDHHQLRHADAEHRREGSSQVLGGEREWA
jgi:hypothetical protein